MFMQLAAALAQTKPVLHPLAVDFFAQAAHRFGSLDPLTASVVTNLEHFCLDTGKQVRPFLVGAGAALSESVLWEKATIQPAVARVMLAVQLTHQRILMADDVADRDEQRYGQPTVEYAWRQQISQTDPYRQLPESEQHHIARSYSEVAGIWLQQAINTYLNQTILTPHQRQLLHELWLTYMYEHTVTGWLIHQEQGQEVLSTTTSLSRYLQGLELVTADYTMVGPLLIGAALGRHYRKLAPVLQAYGRAAGILFQLSDDMIGIFGETAKTGKPVGNDVREGKKTVPIQLAMQKGNAAQQQRLSQLVGKRQITAAEVEEVRQIIHDTGAHQATVQQMQDYASQCQNILRPLPNSPEKQMLGDLAQLLVQRDR